MTADLLKSLFLANRAALVRFMLARGASADEAEDLVQDLFLAIDTRSIGSVSNPRAYLHRMANNLLLDRRREARRRLRREQDSSGTVVPGHPADATTRTDDALIAREELAEVRAALATLPDRTLQIFRRFRLDGERQKAIANDLGISVSAVEKHLQRAYEVVLSTKDGLDAENVPGRRLGGKVNSDAT